MILPTRQQIADAIERHRAWPAQVNAIAQVMREHPALGGSAPWSSPDADPLADIRAYIAWDQSPEAEARRNQEHDEWVAYLSRVFNA